MDGRDSKDRDPPVCMAGHEIGLCFDQTFASEPSVLGLKYVQLGNEGWESMVAPGSL